MSRFRRSVRPVPMLVCLFVALSIGFLRCYSSAQTLVNGRQSLVFDGSAAKLVIDLGGGSIVDFHLSSMSLNPLNWGLDGEKSKPHAMCHFLCLDRWGAPSEAEAKNGMPFHGEASNVPWRVLSVPLAKDDVIDATMSATLPLAGLEVKRQIRLSKNAPCFTVTEE